MKEDEILDLIISEFGNLAINRYNMFMYKYEDAIQVVKRCQDYNLQIYRIEAFKVGDKFIQPFMEHSVIYDNGDNNQGINVWEHALNFLETKSDLGLIFEIFYDGYI